MLRTSLIIAFIMATVLLYGCSYDSFSEPTPESIMPNGISVEAYDPNVDYMEKMKECAEDGSEFALQLGAIFEQQRNLKIQFGMFEEEQTDYFCSYNADEIRAALDCES